VDEQLLALARRALQRLTQAEREARLARIEFVRAVLHGSPPRDVATALGLSDQQLDEILQRSGGAGRLGRRHAPDAEVLICTFCGRSQREVRRLIAGPGVYTCDQCVALAEGVTRTGTAARTQLGTVQAVPRQDRQSRCSFCHKNRDQVTALAAIAPNNKRAGSEPTAICTECLSLCRETLTEELA